jgi:hypothetical protein
MNTRPSVPKVLQPAVPTGVLLVSVVLVIALIAVVVSLF